MSQVKLFLIAFVIAGVSGLVYALFINQTLMLTFTGDIIDMSFQNFMFTPIRGLLLFIDLAWLVILFVLYGKLSRNAGVEQPEEKVTKIEKFEKKYFIFSLSLLVFLLLLSLAVPLIEEGRIAQFESKAGSDFDEEIKVSALLFDFKFTYDNNVDVLSKNPDAPAVVLSVGVKYKFVLTTEDTTHGFGLYNPEGVLKEQAQIIPDHTVDLYIKFQEAGIYRIQCLEYCGLNHQGMVAYIEVTA